MSEHIVRSDEGEPIWAHTPTSNDPGTAQLLAPHITGTSSLCGQFASAFGAEAAGRLIGLLHDLGKAPRPFRAICGRATRLGSGVSTRRGADSSTSWRG